MKFQRILIGIDDSKFSENAAEYGFELAHAFKAHVGLVHITEPIVVPPINDPGMIGSMIPSLDINDPELINIQEEYASNLVDRTIEKYAGKLEVTRFNEFGSTADAIIDCIGKFNSDLVVLGTHSRTGLDRFFMGSIAEDVVRHSPVPVLVVPLKKADQ